VENESRDGNPVEADKAPSTSESIVTAQDEQGSFLSKQINAVRKFTSAALQSVFQKDVRLWTNKSPFNMCFFEFVHLLLARYMMCVGCVRGISYQTVALQSESLTKEFCFQGVSWHEHKHWLAFIAGPDQVFVHDFEDTGNNPPSMLFLDIGAFFLAFMHFYSLIGEVPIDILAECVFLQWVSFSVLIRNF
jgi:hypothetical protein